MLSIIRSLHTWEIFISIEILKLRECFKLSDHAYESAYHIGGGFDACAVEPGRAALDCQNCLHDFTRDHNLLMTSGFVYECAHCVYERETVTA